MQTSQEPTAALLDGRYQLAERIGTGGMAEVYRAEDLLLGRTVAVKVLRVEGDLLASTDRARVESTALASLNHPGLVTLLDARVDPGHTAYLVMEFVDGPTLAQRIGCGPLSDADAARLATQLASALHAVHCAGIIHRDVKPSNVLLAPGVGPDGGFHAKLTDFGAARLTDTSGVTSPGVIIGTAAYLAPEQVRDRTASPPSDIYALGLVLLEALTGERAFAQTTDIDAILARLVEDPVIPPQVDEGWARLLRRMTDADPAARPTAAQVVREVAELGFLSTDDEADSAPVWGEPVPARALAQTEPTAVLAPPPSAPRRRFTRAKVSALSAALAAAAIAGAVAWPTIDAQTASTVVAPPAAAASPAPSSPALPAATRSADTVSLTRNSGASGASAQTTGGGQKQPAKHAKATSAHGPKKTPGKGKGH